MGKLGSKQTHARMYPEDCQLIAKTRLRQEPPLDNLEGIPEFALGIEWLEVGYK